MLVFLLAYVIFGREDEIENDGSLLDMDLPCVLRGREHSRVDHRIRACIH